MKTQIRSVPGKLLNSIFLTLALLGCVVRPVSAADTNLGHISASDLKSQCEAEGGTFTMTPDGENWICTKKCGGSTCIIICDEEGGCSGHTPDKRVKPQVTPSTLSDVLNGKISENRGGRFPWGIVGWLGFLGMATFWYLEKRKR